jgi:hypothetical protein
VVYKTIIKYIICKPKARLILLQVIETPVAFGRLPDTGSRPRWPNALASLGRQLNARSELRVLNGGVVVPSTPTVPSSSLGVEMQDVDAKATRRSETRPRQRAPGWQGPPRRPWPTGAAAPVIGRPLEKLYESELSGLAEFYPDPQFWHQVDGTWILWKSKVLDDLPRQALFLTGISNVWPLVLSWGFWTNDLTLPRWIGPRHTNFYDGSICAFEVKDETWLFGQSIVKLLDLYTVWALRHLHLEILGTWPGQQVAHYGIERIFEQGDTELCGCGSAVNLYRDCCKPKDVSQTRAADAVQFVWFPRTPPRSISAVFLRGEEPPHLSELIS